jgi:hypothetical protein
MKDWLPAYAAGTLPGADRDRVREHLAGCGRCRAELAAWQAIADAAPPPDAAPDPGRMVRAVLTRSAMEGLARNGRSRRRLQHLAELVVAEARLIRPAVPIASALVMALGVAVVLLQGGARTGAASGGAGLVLALLNALVGAWLGPMALLSSLGLLIAVRFGPDVALGAAVTLWAVRVQAGVLARDEWPARWIVAVWSTNAAVLAVSVAVTVIAVALAGRDGEPHRGWRATHPM